MDKFYWGAASSSYQIEGAAEEDGKKLSIWDVFSHTEGKVFNGDNGDIACDSYHRFSQDIALLKTLGVNSYRFSLSWPRILPDGKEKINQAGIDFYNHFINELIANGIVPVITLFHWDLPLTLGIEGGFMSPEMPKWFAHYADVVSKAFGDRVKIWITFNEPQCIIGNGYSSGTQAPGYKLKTNMLLFASHNLLKAHGEAVREIRKNVSDAKISFCPTCRACIPDDPTNIKLVEKTKNAFFSLDRNNYLWSVVLFSDPVFLGIYPKEYYSLFKEEKPNITKEDLKLISQPLDFIGENIYSGDFYSFLPGEKLTKLPLDPKINPKADVEWEDVVPEALYWGPKFLYERYKRPIVITENGMCDNTVPDKDGRIHDTRRINYLKEYIEQMLKVKHDGTDIRGYFCWSILDNFEWEQGYSKRFGLVYTDYKTLNRIPKDSYYFYQKLIKGSK